MNSLATLEENNLLFILLQPARKNVKFFKIYLHDSRKCLKNDNSGIARKYSFSSVMWQARCSNNINLFRGVWQLRHKLQVSVTSVRIH